jgi:hypothetical protein
MNLIRRAEVGVLREKQGKERIVESRFVGLRATVGRALGLLGVVFAVLGIFVVEGISIEYVGIMLGGIGYYLGLTSQDRVGQLLGIAAAVLNVVSMGVSGLEALP